MPMARAIENPATPIPMNEVAQMASKKPRSRVSLVIFILLLACVLASGMWVAVRLVRRPPAYERRYRMGLLYARREKHEEAIREFQNSLELKPDYLLAQKALINALIAAREFKKAEAAIDEAKKMGLDAFEAVLLRAEVLSARAGYRITTEGEKAEPEANVELCDSVIKDQLQRAIQMITDHIEEAEKPYRGYAAIGTLYFRKAETLERKWRVLREAGDLAESLDDAEEAGKQHAAALSVIPLMAEAHSRGIDAYVRAMELEPKEPAPRLALARLYIDRRVLTPRPDAVRKLLEPILEDDPHHADALLLLAKADSLEGGYEDALDRLKMVPRTSEQEYALNLAQAQVLVAAKRWEEAEPLCRLLVQTKGAADPNANFLLGKVLLETDKADKAVNYLQNIFRHEGRWPGARLELARALEQSGKWAQAVDAYKEVLTDLKYERTSKMAFLTDAMRWQQMEYQACVALSRQLKEIASQEAFEYAVRALRLFPHTKEALELAVQMAKATDSPPDTIEKLLYEHIKALSGTEGVDAALAVCEEHLQKGQGRYTRLAAYKGLLLERKGSYSAAAETYKTLYEKWPDRRLADDLARVYRRLGQSDNERRLYERLLEKNKADTGAMASLAALLIRTDQKEAARDLLEEAAQQVGSEGVRSLLFAFYRQEGDDAEAEKLVRSFLEIKPNDPFARVALADILRKAGKLEEARDEYERALESDSKCVPAYSGGFLKLQQGEANDALTIFQLAERKFPAELWPKIEMAVAWHAAGRADLALPSLKDVCGRAVYMRRDVSDAWWHRALVLVELGKLDEAIAANASISGARLGIEADRLSLLKSVAALEPELRHEVTAGLSTLIALSRARFFPGVVEKSEALRKLLPQEPLVACWGIDALDRQGKHEEAVSQYEALINEHPDFVFARKLLGDSHARNGETEAALDVWEKALPIASDKLAAVLHLTMAATYQREGQLDAAISSYQGAMQDPALAPLACNDLAWLLAVQKNDPVEALPLAERALRLSPRLPHIKDTTGWVYYLNGKSEEAVKLLEEAKAGMPGHPTIRYHLGVVYLEVGRTKEGKAELEEALLISPTFPEAQAAREALGKL
jgi:tetratricopeptide (TPR) repeat protein